MINYQQRKMDIIYKKKILIFLKLEKIQNITQHQKEKSIQLF